MNGVGRRLIGVLFAAGLALGLLGGAAFAGSGSDAASDAGTVSGGGDRIRLVQTQETTPPTPGNGTRKPCPNRDGGGSAPGATPGTTPSDTSI